MKVWRLDGRGISALNLANEEPVVPGPGEVQIRMEAAAINYRDVGIVEGMYSAGTHLVPFSDGAGTVVAVGEAVADFAAGDPVVTLLFSVRDTEQNHAHLLQAALERALR